MAPVRAREILPVGEAVMVWRGRNLLVVVGGRVHARLLFKENVAASHVGYLGLRLPVELNIYLIALSRMGLTSVNLSLAFMLCSSKPK